MSDNVFSPSVTYKDPRGALEWLEKAFGFELSMLVESPDGDDQTIHAEMCLNGRGRVMVGGEWSERTRSPKSLDGANTQSLHVDLDEDVDAHCERAREAGARIVEEPNDQFYGARRYRALDPEGHVWTFSKMLADAPTREEAEKAGGVKIHAKDWD